MKISELQEKDVVNLKDGKKIGNIVDISIDKEGNMRGIMVERYRFFLSLFTNHMVEIQWNQIAKIGKDVILVN